MMFSDLTLLWLLMYLLIYHPLKLNNQVFLNLKLRIHEYASGLIPIPKTELFCSCKHRKSIGQNKVKIYKL